ncbi:DUF5592 family protein [Eubacterium multiforme]|uniref:PrgI family protein n=1 Tax=Eubacterium multiforme TaxID=83339 RepID=A0ABT9UTM3_9FIRM|nr:DUF5592 family protein [Eubacterium multiforme]MDQ0149624.1 hypothetical protein [Eubacterium multiforme]
MQYKIIKDLNHEPLFMTNITLFDLGFIGIGMVIAVIFSFLVYDTLIFKAAYFIFCFFSLVYLTGKSRTNPKRRNLQSIYYAISRNRYVYRRFYE